MKSAQPLLLLALFAALSAAGGEAPLPPANPQTWRPFKELPDILFYEGFEGENEFFTQGTVVPKFTPERTPPPAPAAAPKAEKAAAGAPAAPAAPAAPGAPAAPNAAAPPAEKMSVDQDPAFPSAHAYKLGKVDGNTDKLVSVKFEVSRSQLKIPSGLMPMAVTIEFNLWTNEPGQVGVKAYHTRGDAEGKKNPPRANTWVPISLKLDQIVSKTRIEKNSLISAFDIWFKPTTKTNYPDVFIDDFTVGTIPHPLELLPRILRAQGRPGNIEPTIAKTGFAFPAAIQDKIRLIAHGKGQHKSKLVLVAGGTPEETTGLCKELLAAQAKLGRDGGYNFVPAVDPSGAAIGGMDDMHLFLSYNLQKTTPEAALLCCSTLDVQSPNRPGEGLRVLLERAAGFGTMPLVAAPSGADAFAKSVENACNYVGGVWMDGSFTPKDVPPEASRLAIFASVAMNALKMMHDSLTQN